MIIKMEKGFTWLLYFGFAQVSLAFMNTQFGRSPEATEPGNVTQFHTRALDPSTVLAIWDLDGTADGFMIAFCKTNGHCSKRIVQQDFSATARLMNVTDLTFNTEYLFSITPFIYLRRSAGVIHIRKGETVFSKVWTLPLEPKRIEMLYVEAINSTAVLATWEFSSPNPADGFEIFVCKLEDDCKLSFLLTSSGDSRSRVITMLSPWTHYQVSICAFKHMENSNLIMCSERTSRMVQTHSNAPSKVVNLAITNTSATSITFTWNKPRYLGGPLSGYIVMVETDKSSFRFTLDRNETACTLDDLDPGSRYKITVIAYNILQGDVKVSSQWKVYRNGVTITAWTEIET